MSTYSEPDVLSKIWWIFNDMLNRYEGGGVSIQVSNLVMTATGFTAKITIKDGESTASIAEKFSKSTFYDCQVEDSLADKIETYKRRYDLINRQLNDEEPYQTGIGLTNVKNHKSRIKTYGDLIDTAIRDNRKDSIEYYFNKLSNYMDDAERYLDMLEQDRRDDAYFNC